MPLQRTKTLATGLSSVTTGSWISFSRRIDQAGTLFVDETTGGGTYTLQIEGRMDSSDTAVVIPLDGAANTAAAVTTTVTDADTATAAYAAFSVPIFPQMRVNMTAHSGASVVTVKVDE